jgi:DNA-binding NtrC family response regulator
MPQARILIVEDEQHMARTLEFLLQDKYRVTLASTGRSAIDQAKKTDFDLYLLDMNLPDTDGLQVLRSIKEFRSDAVAIMVTARKDVKTAVECMKAGAYDYIQKPFEKEDLLIGVERALEKRRLSRQNEHLYEEARAPYGFENVVARSEAMQKVFDLARRAASTDTSVLITGETGVGKDLIARAIHFGGARARGPFIAFNCARYTDSLIESELFGHEAGAFTGAQKARKGKFEQAHEGTLFLDEIGLMPMPTQSRMLRVLEERRVERVGGEGPIDVDVRIIAATNSCLEEMIAEKTFRQDLYYRLKVLKIEVPPLRERREDIPLLAEHFVNAACEKAARPPKAFEPDAMELLRQYDWPGNVRELQNLVDMLVVTIDSEAIPSEAIAKDLLSRVARHPMDLASIPTGGNYGERVNAFERQMLADALERNAWNKLRTAKELGWHRNTVDYKIKKLGIVRKDEGGEKK